MVKYDIRVEHGKEGECQISLSGDFFVDNIAELKKVLLESLASSNRVLLDISSVNTVDLTFLQIMKAAVKLRSSRSKDIGFVGIMPDTVRNFLVRSGFPNFTVECVMNAA